MSLLYENLARVLAPILSIEGWHAVLFGVVAFFEGLESGHEVVAAGHTVCDDTLCDTGCDGTFDNGGNGVHGADYFGLELWGYVELDLLEEVF